MMSYVQIFATLLLTSFAWNAEASWSTGGYKQLKNAINDCGPREIYQEGYRFYCYDIRETILNEYERQFGKATRDKINDNESFRSLIKKIEDNSFCESKVNELLVLLFPDYKQYAAVGQVVRKFSYLTNYCSYSKSMQGAKITEDRLKLQINTLLDQGICEKVKKAEGNTTVEGLRLQEVGNVLKNNGYCDDAVTPDTVIKKICRYFFSAWMICAIARLAGFDV